MKILYIKVVDRKIEIHTTTRVLKGAVMLQLERLLSNYGFDKVNQNILINTKEAKYFDPYDMKILFNNGESCSVSRSNKRKIVENFDKI